MQGSERNEQGAIDRLLARALPEEFPDDDRRARPRALLLMRFTLMGAAFTAVLFAYFAVYLQKPFTGLMNGIYAIALVLTPVVLRRTGSVEAAAHWAISSAFTVLLIECWAMGGVAGRAYHWLTVLPVGAMLLCGTRGGAVWSALCTGAIATIGALHYRGWIPSAPALDPGTLAETAVSATSMGLALGGLSWLAETRAKGLLENLESERRMFHELSITDPLTGLANRTLVLEHLNRSGLRCRRYGLRGCFLFIDLVGFKQVNDECGHATGDRVLRQVARRLEGALRRSDLAGRIGGDEFALIVEGVGSRMNAITLARKVGECLSQPFRIERTEVRIGASIGIALYPEEGNDGGPVPEADDEVEEIMKRADAAMYRAKRSGDLYAIA